MDSVSGIFRQISTAGYYMSPLNRRANQPISRGGQGVTAGEKKITESDGNERSFQSKMKLTDLWSWHRVGEFFTKTASEIPAYS